MELGEIENQMLKHKEIKEGVVILREDKQGERYLAAYVVADRELTANELKIYLSKELPEYMVPLYFTQLDKLPLTPMARLTERHCLFLMDGEIQENVISLHEMKLMEEFKKSGKIYLRSIESE